MPRDLEASRREEQPKTCTLGGETLRCVPTIAFGALIDIATGGLDRITMWNFLHAAVDDKDIPKLEKVLRRKHRPVTGDEILEAVTELVGVYSGRPTGRPSESPDGPRSTGRKSKAGSSSQEGTESAA